DLAPGDPRLLAVETVSVSGLDGGRPESCEIRAGFGLGESLAPELPRRQDRPHVPAALLVVPEGENRRAENVETDDRRELGRARRGELLVDDDLLRRRPSAAAELGRPRAADVAGLVAA